MTALVFDVIEELTRVTPFGLGLWDVAAGSLVSDGFTMRLRQFTAGRMSPPIDARPNRAGVFIASEIPTLRAVEFGDAPLKPDSPPQVFLVEVRHTASRYIPFAMFVDLPRSGFSRPACVTSALLPELAAPGSPSVEPRYVPIFGAASRPVPAGSAVLRAHLIDKDTKKPAEYAVLEVRESGRLLGRGISDEDGEVAVLFAYPEPESAPSASPPASPPAAARAKLLTEQEWSVDIVARYARNLKRYTFGSRERPLADLCDVLQQPVTTIRTPESAPVPITRAQLHYGQPLVLGKAADSTDLFITPA